MKVNYNLNSFNVEGVRNEEEYVNRVAASTFIEKEEFDTLASRTKFIGVTDRFKDVIQTFNTDPNETPAGFRRELILEGDGVLRVDLVRDISYDKNGLKRPTNLLFSADSANPYEIAPVKGILANLTCNPGIIYDLFINNPQANVGNKFKNRDEVMGEIGNILGPGADISVELNNPFEADFNKILEEAEKFKEMLNPYRVVIKVPHTGPVNANNVNELLKGDKKLSKSYYDVNTEDAFRSHNLVLKLTEMGYRINYTLMFEPYQTQLALQAKPYFINTFLRQRLGQSETIKAYVDTYKATRDKTNLINLKQYLYDTDYFSQADMNIDLIDVLTYAEALLTYRELDNKEGLDGLDGMRHNLRCLRNTNLSDTRLIVCSMEGDKNYPDLDKLLNEPEFMDMQDKVVLTAEPGYLARFTSTNQVITYQRRFMNAVQGQS